MQVEVNAKIEVADGRVVEELTEEIRAALNGVGNIADIAGVASVRVHEIAPPGIAPGGALVATEYDCQPTRARGVLRWIARGLWDPPPQVMRENPDGPSLWRFDHDTGTYRLFDPNAGAAA